MEKLELETLDIDTINNFAEGLPVLTHKWVNRHNTLIRYDTTK